jgi:hypothetical protein
MLADGALNAKRREEKRGSCAATGNSQAARWQWQKAINDGMWRMRSKTYAAEVRRDELHKDMCRQARLVRGTA